MAGTALPCPRWCYKDTHWSASTENQAQIHLSVLLSPHEDSGGLQGQKPETHCGSKCFTLFLLPWLTRAKVWILQMFCPGRSLPSSISCWFSIHPRDNQYGHTAARPVRLDRPSLPEPELPVSQVKPLDVVPHAEPTVQLLFNSRLQNRGFFRHGCCAVWAQL